MTEEKISVYTTKIPYKTYLSLEEQEKNITKKRMKNTMVRKAVEEAINLKNLENEDGMNDFNIAIKFIEEITGTKIDKKELIIKMIGLLK